MNMRFLRRVGAATGLATAALSSGAATVQLDGWAFGSGNAVSVSSPNFSGAGGGFKGSLSGAGIYDAAAFVTYCIELTQNFNLPSGPMSDYSVLAGNAYFGAVKAARLGQLMTHVADTPGAVDNAFESTALQLAIWNTVYDIDASLVSNAGVFFESTNNTMASYAGTLLSASAATVSRFTVAALVSPQRQDFLLVGPLAVPEPGSLALVGTAVGALAFVRRRRLGR